MVAGECFAYDYYLQARRVSHVGSGEAVCCMSIVHVLVLWRRLTSPMPRVR